MKKDRGQAIATTVYLAIFILAAVGLTLCLFFGWCKSALATNIDYSKTPERIEPYAKTVDADGA